MYNVYGNITCDFCQSVVNDKDYIIVKDNDAILHYCNEECKNKHEKLCQK